MYKRIILLFSIIILFIIAFIIIKESSYKYKITINRKDNCTKEKELYYTDKEGNNYFTSCLNSIIIDINSNKMELKDALKEKMISFEDIYNDALYNNIYRDGGSRIYKYKHISILKCHKILDEMGKYNTDITIGDKNLDIIDGYCSDSLDDMPKPICSFTRTYLVKEIKNIIKEDNDYTEVILYKFQAEEVSVMIKTNIVKYLEENKYYEFTFDNENNINIDDATIVDLFKNYNLRTYNETNLVGLDQKQEPIC